MTIPDIRREKLEALKKRKFDKKLKGGLRKCLGHWINKGMRLRNNDCYDEDGKCLICGGYKNEK